MAQIVSSEEESAGGGERHVHLQPAALHGVRAPHSAHEQAEAAQHERPLRPPDTDQHRGEHAAGISRESWFWSVSDPV